MVRQWQESFYQNRYSHSTMNQGQPNFTVLANSYGIKGIYIQTELEFETQFYKYKNYPNPILFDCLVVENENCYPMVSPGRANVAMDGINYQQHEMNILKRHLDDNDPLLKEFKNLDSNL